MRMSVALERQVEHCARVPARQDRFHVRMPVAGLLSCAGRWSLSCDRNRLIGFADCSILRVYCSKFRCYGLCVQGRIGVPQRTPLREHRTLPEIRTENCAFPLHLLPNSHLT